MKNYRLLKRTFKKGRFARIKRTLSNGDCFINRGYIVNVTKEFTFLRETENFSLQGVIVIPNSDIKTVRYNKYDRYYDFVMESEGEKNALKKYTIHKAHTWLDVFTFLKDEDKYVIVELEKSENKAFIIGEILSIRPKNVRIRYFDAAGNWDAKPTKVRYSDITKITFDDRYIQVFRKYIKNS
jgi:hypothetical protein